jgi:hypothetical protein
MKFLFLLVTFLISFGMGQTYFYPTQPGLDTSKYLVPEDLTYLGAFRLPNTRAGSVNGFTYLGRAMTYSPKGDSAGPDDGFPGALTLTGHVNEFLTARIDIPTPVISKDYNSLPIARVIVPFKNFGMMPPNPGPTVMALEEVGDKIFVSMSDAYLPNYKQRMLGWADLDLSNMVPQRKIGPDRDDCFSDYMFAIPKWWADKYSPGKILAIGRHREGDLCGQGPAIFAMNPLTETSDTSVALTAAPMLKYKPRVGGIFMGPLVQYSHGGDVYRDVKFLESGNKSAILMTGKKGLTPGYTPDHYGTSCGYQGFHDPNGYRPYFMFYNPDSLGNVILGKTESHIPQPYAGLDINHTMMRPNLDSCADRHLATLAYDRTNNLLYANEYRANDREVIHVWKVKQYAATSIPPSDTVVIPPPDTTNPVDTIPGPPKDTTCKADTVIVEKIVVALDTVTLIDSVALQHARDSINEISERLNDVRLQLSEANKEIFVLKVDIKDLQDSLNVKPDTVIVTKEIIKDTVWNFNSNSLQIQIKTNNP